MHVEQVAKGHIVLEIMRICFTNTHGIGKTQVEKPIQWHKSYPTDGAYMTCMEMSGSGVWI